jgi:hypothetical protein
VLVALNESEEDYRPFENIGDAFDDSFIAVGGPTA